MIFFLTKMADIDIFSFDLKQIKKGPFFLSVMCEH